jgi:hypothetical protein
MASPTAPVTEETTATAETPVTTEPTPAEIAPPTETPRPAFGSLGSLPVSMEIDLTVVNQWGGVPKALAVDGTTAYVGFGPRLLIVDTSDPAEPQLLGQSEPLPDVVHDVVVDGGLAYLAAGAGGLIILDVSDPANIQIVNGGSNYEASMPANAESISITGGLAYIVDFNRPEGKSTLLHFDVSDPQQVTLLDAYQLSPNSVAEVAGDLIVVVGLNQMQLRDAAKPAAILSQTGLAGGNYTSRAVVEDNIITVVECCNPTGIERFDVSDPYHPAALGPLQEVETMPSYHVAADGQTLVSASIFGEFVYCQSTVNLVEIGDESSEVIASLDPENCLGALVLEEDKLFLAGRSGLQIYDLSDPANPVLLSQFRHPVGFHDAQGLARYDGLTYALNAEGRSFDLATLDLSLPAADLLLDQQVIGQEPLLDLLVSGDTLIASVWMGSLYTLDISDPGTPQLLHRPVEGELYSGDLFAMDVKDDVLYMPVASGEVISIGAIDLSDPANLALATEVETGDWTVLDMTVVEDILYVLSQGEDNHITLYDVSQPLAPQQIATLTMTESANRLAVTGDTLYAACDFYNCQAVYAIDVADAENPHIFARWTIPFGVQDMVADEQGTIYLVTSEQSIWSMDGSDPAQLRLTGTWQLPGQFARLNIEGDQIYAATFEGGLYQLQVER